MKLSELVEHTGKWIGPSATSVGSYARFLREARLISGGIKGGGAADMTADDKITLLAAVLGCGSARSCAQSVSAILALTSNTTKVPKEVKRDLTFFSQSNFKNALLHLFGDIQSGKIDHWKRSVAQHGLDISHINLTLTVEIDANFARIAVGAIGRSELEGIPAKISIQYEQTFGNEDRADPPGFSRRIHEVSFDRLVGWGKCLIE